MLEIINNALNSNNYYVVLYDNKVYIYNYKEIISFSSVLILISLSTTKLKVKGENLLIKKMTDKELLIEGDISNVKYE